jgi:hypothetical protein
VISDDLARFIESGLSLLVGTRDGRLVPEATRGLAPRVEPGGREVTIFLPDASGRVALANLAANGRIAVCISRPSDHRTFQLKGRVVGLAAAVEAERPHLDRYRCAFAQELAQVGLPARLTLRMAWWPCHAVRFEVAQVFVQTPGPGAGEPLRAGAERAP